MQTHTLIHTYMYIYNYVHVCIICTYMYMHICMHTYMYIHTHIHTHAHVHTYIHVHTGLPTFLCMHTHMHRLLLMCLACAEEMRSVLQFLIIILGPTTRPLHCQLDKGIGHSTSLTNLDCLQLSTDPRICVHWVLK